VPFLGGGVAVAAVAGALFAFGVFGGGGDDDDNGPTFTFEPFPSDSVPTETFPPFTDFPTDTGGFDDGGVGDTADNPVPLGEEGVVAGRMSVIVFASDPQVIGTETEWLITLDVYNAGNDPLDVFFEPFYFMIGDTNVEYDEFDYGCDEFPDRITGTVQPGDFAFGNVCFAIPSNDTIVVLYIELDGDRVFFEV
jgi:hypothetical protein